MDKLSLILIIIGLGVLTFSAWSFILVKRHIRQFKNNYKHASSLTDEKYYELKSRQEYIISSLAVILGIIGFLGFSSITDIKNEMTRQLEAEKHKLEELDSHAKQNYIGLDSMRSSYGDSVKEALHLVSALKNRVSQISTKDIVRQNIYIIDPLIMGKFPIDKTDPNHMFRVVHFKDLATISGQKLPTFNMPPSLIAFSTTHASLLIKDVTKESFEVALENYYPADKNDNGDTTKFSIWISQKPSKIEFNSDFSQDFK
jgi:hypothetical protein